MRFYEIVLITNSEISEEGHKELLGKMEDLLKKKRKKAEKGEVLRVDAWGVKKLSSPIEKQSRGRYDLVTIECLPDSLFELERNLKIFPEVLRFQSIRLMKEPQFEEAPVEKEKPAEAPAEEAKSAVEEAPAAEADTGSDGAEADNKTSEAVEAAE